MVRVFRFQNGNLGLGLPNDVAASLGLNDGSEVEFRQIGRGIVAMIGPGDNAAPAQTTSRFSAEETALLRKLNTIKFAERNKAAISKQLTATEQSLLETLLERGAISYYDKGKYEGNGVYTISNSCYAEMQGKPQASSAAQQTAQPRTPQNSEFKRELTNKGFMIIKEQERAKLALAELSADIAMGDVTSVRGFDKAFYFVTTQALSGKSTAIVEAITKGSASIAKISGATGIDAGLCRAILEIIRESGDIIEKRHDHYSVV